LRISELVEEEFGQQVQYLNHSFDLQILAL